MQPTTITYACPKFVHACVRQRNALDGSISNDGLPGGLVGVEPELREEGVNVDVIIAWTGVDDMRTQVPDPLGISLALRVRQVPPAAYLMVTGGAMAMSMRTCVPGPRASKSPKAAWPSRQLSVCGCCTNLIVR